MMVDHLTRPSPISWNDVLEARARLRTAGVGLPDHSLADILHEPLGPDEMCLSANEVAEWNEGGHVHDPLSPRVAHVITCGGCQESLDLFKRIDFGRPRNAQIRFGQITIPTNYAAPLGLKIANFGRSPFLMEMEPGSLIVESNVLRACGGQVVEEILPPSGAREATFIGFREYETRLDPGQSVENAPIRLTGVTLGGELFVGRGYADVSRATNAPR